VTLGEIGGIFSEVFGGEDEVFHQQPDSSVDVRGSTVDNLIERLLNVVTGNGAKNFVNELFQLFGSPL
jgi:hypothetical protein